MVSLGARLVAVRLLGADCECDVVCFGCLRRDYLDRRSFDRCHRASRSKTPPHAEIRWLTKSLDRTRRAASVSNSNVFGRPRRPVLAFGKTTGALWQTEKDSSIAVTALIFAPRHSIAAFIKQSCRSCQDGRTGFAGTLNRVQRLNQISRCRLSSKKSPKEWKPECFIPSLTRGMTGSRA